MSGLGGISAAGWTMTTLHDGTRVTERYMLEIQIALHDTLRTQGALAVLVLLQECKNYNFQTNNNSKRILEGLNLRRDEVVVETLVKIVLNSVKVNIRNGVKYISIGDAEKSY